MGSGRGGGRKCQGRRRGGEGAEAKGRGNNDNDDNDNDGETIVIVRVRAEGGCRWAGGGVLCGQRKGLGKEMPRKKERTVR